MRLLQGRPQDGGVHQEPLMKEVVAFVEAGLGPARLASLKGDDDDMQQFWLGVLEALPRMRGAPDVGFLISSGYGSVRNARRAERTASGMTVCSGCGAHWGYRQRECPRCGSELSREVRVSEFSEEVRGVRGRESEVDLRLTVEAFVETLEGTERRVAKRWLLDRADLYHENHGKVIAAELGVSAAYVSAVKKAIRARFASWINR